MNYFTSTVTKKIIVFITAVYLLLIIAFRGKLFSMEWIVGSYFVAVTIIFQIKKLNRKWIYYPEKKFTKKIFWTSFLVRLFVLLGVLIIAKNTWGRLFYVGAVDATKYFRVATQARAVFHEQDLIGSFNFIVDEYNGIITDVGFPFFLFLTTFIVGTSAFGLKLTSCIIGSLVVLKGYKIANLIFEKKTARIAAILLMVFPISLFFNATILKESLLTYVILEVLYLNVKMIKTLKYKTKDILLLVAFIAISFFLRAAVSILLFLIATYTLTVYSAKRKKIVGVTVTIIIITLFTSFLIITGQSQVYYDNYIEAKNLPQERIEQMSNINELVSLLGLPVYLLISIFTPFPSLVYIPNQFGLPHDEYNYMIAGNIFWNVFALFAVTGLIWTFRKKRGLSSPLWSFVIGYQLILLQAMMFTSVRFSYPALPVFVLFTAYGLSLKKLKKYYSLYLLMMAIAIIGWNYVRLKGRGML